MRLRFLLPSAKHETIRFSVFLENTVRLRFCNLITEKQCFKPWLLRFCVFHPEYWRHSSLLTRGLMEFHLSEMVFWGHSFDSWDCNFCLNCALRHWGFPFHPVGDFSYVFLWQKFQKMIFYGIFSKRYSSWLNSLDLDQILESPKFVRKNNQDIDVYFEIFSIHFRIASFLCHYNTWLTNFKQAEYPGTSKVNSAPQIIN